MVVPFFAKGSVRDPDTELSTYIPIINSQSGFVKSFNIENYQVRAHYFYYLSNIYLTLKVLLQSLDKQYKQLQMIS